jgi:hypothetical protein
VARLFQSLRICNDRFGLSCLAAGTIVQRQGFLPELTFSTPREGSQVETPSAPARGVSL